MFLIETVFSIITLLAMAMLADRHRYAPTLGLAVNVCWVSMWIYTAQYGFLFLDLGIVLIYLRAFRKQLKGEW